MIRPLAAAAICTLAPAMAAAGPVDEMMAADTAFSEMAQSESVPAAFAAYADKDVRMFPVGAQPYTGRDAMIEQFAQWPEGATLVWTPVEGIAGPSGDFGFTWGRYVFSAPGADGQRTSSHGKYVSIWRRDDDGNWKFVADIGNANPEPTE